MKKLHSKIFLIKAKLNNLRIRTKYSIVKSVIAYLKPDNFFKITTIPKHSKLDNT